MIKDLLQNKTAPEIIEIKVTEICKLDFVGDYKNVVPGLDIKIVSFEKIKDGVSIRAQAWRNGEQIGFGKDGTVDTEHFRIFNPPILVRDPNGTEITLDDEGNVLRKLSENPKEAILQSLADTIRIVGKRGDKITKGKIGNTTSTFYPPAAAASARTRLSGTIAAGWNAVVTGTSGDNLNAGEGPQNFQAEKDATHYYVGRGFNSFDTSTIADTDTVSAVTFSVFVVGVNNADTTRATLRIATPADPANIANADYDTYSGSALSTDINLASITTSAYNDFTGNATFIAAVNKTGYTTVCSMNGKDIDNSAPTGLNEITFYQQARAGSTEDPKLVVEHAAASGPANMKTWDGLATASVKTMDGLAIASVKTWNGLT